MSDQPINEDEPYFMVSFLYPTVDYDGAQFVWATIEYTESYLNANELVGRMRKDFRTHKEAFKFAEKYYDLDLVAIVEQRDPMVDQVLYYGDYGHRPMSQAVRYWVFWYEDSSWLEMDYTNFNNMFFLKGSKDRAWKMLNEFGGEVKIDAKYREPILK